jgi:6-phosphogluconolactonase (cycloisomerase 2 family)
MSSPAAERLYIQTNSTGENEIVVFNRSADGTLLPGGRFRCDGFGTGVTIGPAAAAINSQGSVALSADGQYLFAVNAGSNDLSSFAVIEAGLRLVGKVPSGGPGPVSIGVYGTQLYVVDKFGIGGITGFTIEPAGQLSRLADSRRPLSDKGVEAAQVSFTPDGRFLIVTERATDRIVTYRIGPDGLPGQPESVKSSGPEPFGFAFDPKGRLIVSEAFDDAPAGSAVSSYQLDSSGSPVVISGSVPTHGTAACWIAITPNGNYAYTSNAVSGTISGFRIECDGSLVALDDDGRTGVTGEGSLPSDMVISGDGRNLYVLNGGSQTVGAFTVQSDGSLTPMPFAGGVPGSAVGMAIS